MKVTKGKVTRLYRFFNMAKDAHGEPFALCDEHRETQVVPEGCILNKIADRAAAACAQCAERITAPLSLPVRQFAPPPTAEQPSPPTRPLTGNDVAAHVTAWGEAFVLDRCGNHVERQDTVRELQAVLVWIEEHDTGAA